LAKLSGNALKHSHNKMMKLLSFVDQSDTEAEKWLMEHGFAFFNIDYPGGYTRTRWMNNSGDLFTLVIDPSSRKVVKEFYQEALGGEIFPVNR